MCPIPLAEDGGETKEDEQPTPMQPTIRRRFPGKNPMARRNATSDAILAALREVYLKSSIASTSSNEIPRYERKDFRSYAKMPSNNIDEAPGVDARVEMA
mmetsp:Transcript_18055/g.27996  ORF Transcript_18055/g.27996 Transcript_18055/m.27996 type:complete len:100 (-) Transcript_18055:279-578(-)